MESMLYIYICWGERDRGSDISLLWLLIYFYILLWVAASLSVCMVWFVCVWIWSKHCLDVDFRLWAPSIIWNSKMLFDFFHVSWQKFFLFNFECYTFHLKLTVGAGTSSMPAIHCLTVAEGYILLILFEIKRIKIWYVWIIILEEFTIYRKKPQVKSQLVTDEPTHAAAGIVWYSLQVTQATTCNQPTMYSIGY